ncbi:MAG: ectoine/hydroxyectoine ABC transporter permease subunit EhuD [Planctomycetota bacterium]
MNRGNWSWERVWDALPVILDGLEITLIATAGATLLALVLGLIWAGLRTAPVQAIAWPAHALVEFIRSTPLVVQLLLFYNALLPVLGLDMPPLLVGILGLGVHYSCYMAEVYRSGIEAVPHGQREAATALGLTPGQTFLRIIVPQAIPRVVPALGNYVVAMFKETPLLMVITVADMMFMTRGYVSEHAASMEAYTLVGVLFLLLSLSASMLVRVTERSLPVRHA